MRAQVTNIKAFKPWYFCAVICLFLLHTKHVNATPVDSVVLRCLNQLKQAALHGETFFVKVHAAEDLILLGHPQGLQQQFQQLQQASPDNFIGAARVLARLNKNNPATYTYYLNQMVQQFEQSQNAHTRLGALESLGKLGYAKALMPIKACADTGSNGFKAMARWILANNHKSQTENQLSALLLSDQLNDYRYAAYAFRFMPHAGSLTVTRLKSCLHTIKTDDVARVYVASSLFVHGKKADKAFARLILLSYFTGDVGQRYEVAESLGIAGTTADLKVLKQLLNDENNDVRTAAANAILKLMQYKPNHKSI